MTSGHNFPLVSTAPNQLPTLFISTQPTTRLLHQLLTVGVDNNNLPKIWANHYTKSASWVCVAFPEATAGRLNHNVRATTRDITNQKVISILLQAATSLWQKASLWCPSPCMVFLKCPRSDCHLHCKKMFQTKSNFQEISDGSLIRMP
jgi:hypothetical protein